MIGSSFITQVGMLFLVFGIMFFYIEPTFTNIGKLQDSTWTHREEQQKITAVNQRLFALTEEINAVPARSISLLSTYLPTTFNHVAVSRDISVIAKLAGVELINVEYEKDAQIMLEELTVATPPPAEHSFAVSITGQYEQIKQFLRYLEQNNYPLDVKELDLTVNESEIQLELTIVTYSEAIPLPVAEDTNQQPL